MAAIGSNTVANIQLPQGINPLHNRVANATIPGYDGHWSTQLGKMSEPFVVASLEDTTSLANAKTLVTTTYPALAAGASGALVTLTDNLGNAWSNVEVVRLLRATIIQSSLIVGGINASATHYVRAEWEMRIAQ